MRTITVTARWDDESGTWWTDGEDVRGLCCQGRTVQELIEAVFDLAPSLLVANGQARDGEQIELSVIAERRKTIEAVAA